MDSEAELGGSLLGFNVLGLGFEVLGLGFQVLGLGCDVLGLGFNVLGLGFEVLGHQKLPRFWMTQGPKSRKAASQLRGPASKV